MQKRVAGAIRSCLFTTRFRCSALRQFWKASQREPRPGTLRGRMPWRSAAFPAGLHGMPQKSLLSTDREMIDAWPICWLETVAGEPRPRRSAERLGIEQSPVSRAMRDLEEALGVQLFDRR